MYYKMYVFVVIFVVFFLMIRLPPRSTRTYTLFPYTTLCRSLHPAHRGSLSGGQALPGAGPQRDRGKALRLDHCAGQGTGGTGQGQRPGRSEEHTSELQSLIRISSAVLCFKKNI